MMSAPEPETLPPKAIASVVIVNAYELAESVELVVMAEAENTVAAVNVMASL